MKYILFIGNFIILFQNSFSQRQEFLHDWSAVIEHYACTDNKQIEATYYMYSSHESNQVYSTSHSIVKSKNDKIYQNIDEIITLVDPEIMVLVDHNESTILLDRSPRNYFNVISQISFDTSLHSIPKIEILSLTNSYKRYRIYLRSKEYDKIEMGINPQTKHLIDITLFYSTEISLDEEKPDELSKPKLIIKYKPMIKVQEPFYTIRDNPFFSFDGNRIQAKNTYKRYQCIDNRIKLN